MRSAFLTAALACALSTYISAQSNLLVNEHPDAKTQANDGQISSPSAPSAEVNEPPAGNDVTADGPENTPDTGLTPNGYRRPDRDQRFKNYLQRIGSPFALARYSATAGLLTGRDSPSEWGNKWDGFGRRFANVVGKSVIRNSVAYGLDEAMRLDSKFYPSRDRRVSARMRNALFSAVTARNEKGKRVIGVPVIAGGFASEIVSSKTWYPGRFNYLHGVKGGVINIGITAGFNLIREFIWK